MKNKRIKKYKKFKKRRIWGALIHFLLFSILAVMLLYIAFEKITDHMLQSKLITEYDTVLYMARVYDAGLKNNDFRVYSLLDAEGHNYIIKRADSSRVVHGYGKNTCGKEPKMVSFSAFSDKVETYQDTQKQLIYINKKNRPQIDKKAFVEYLSKDDAYSDNDGGIAFSVSENNDYDDEDDADVDEDIEVGTEADADSDVLIIGDNDSYITVNKNAKMLNIPIWMAVDVNEGTEKLIVQALFNMSVRDVYTYGIIMAILALFVGIILITMLVNAIKSVVNQNHVYKMFFSDVVTRGHNWMYYIITGEQLIHKGIKRNEQYASVNLLFVNYRNYCISHSLEKGEEMLCKVHKILNSNVGKNEICSHASGANFALLLKYNDEEQIKSRVRDMIGQLESLNTSHKFEFQAGIRTIDIEDADGVKIHKDDINIEKEYNAASAARATLNESDGSGIAFFDEKLLEDQIWLDKVQDRQRQAVDNEEFVVYYQPKYDPKTNELRGAEALIRWMSPEFGFVSPGKFIPIFEKNGFITEIDHYMINHVARDQKRWLDQGLKCVPVSVNVSRAHFIESDLAEQIRDMVDAAGTPHEYIEIELTESAFFDDKKAMIETINKLKGYGFSVSMDDFGSGYSSLNSLKDMPLDVLKLDAEFFRGESDGNRGEIVVAEAIRLAKSLNMRTVAEGVEIKEQVEFLAKQGCDMIQGYYFAKPMPGEDYEKRM